MIGYLPLYSTTQFTQISRHSSAVRGRAARGDRGARGAYGDTFSPAKSRGNSSQISATKGYGGHCGRGDRGLLENGGGGRGRLSPKKIRGSGNNINYVAKKIPNSLIAFTDGWDEITNKNQPYFVQIMDKFAKEDHCEILAEMYLQMVL